MTRFADDLFDDLMREHGPTLAHTRVPTAPKRHLAARPVLLTAGAGGLALAATVGTLVATGGGTPAYAVTNNPDGTVTLAVYQQAGIVQANAKLRSLGDRVVVVPVGSNCPSINSLPAPAVPASQINVQASSSGSGPVTIDAQGIPTGDILVIGFDSSSGQFSMRETVTANGNHASASGKVSGSGQAPRGGSMGTASKLTSGPAPSCVSLPAAPAPSGASSGTVSGSSGGPATTHSGSGGGKSTSSNG